VLKVNRINQMWIGMRHALMQSRREKDMEMRNQIRVAVMMAVAAGSALAEMHLPARGDLAVTIPFEFNVGRQTMPAGDYTLLNEGGGRLRLCEDGIRCVTVETSRVDLPGLMKNPTVLFRKAGNGWTLAEIWTTARSGHRLAVGETAEFDCKDTPEYSEIKARTLCVHRASGAARSWH
jgi:hypothetical protein